MTNRNKFSGEVFADSAYRGNHFRDAVRVNGGVLRIVATGMWGRDETETLRKLHEWNQPIHRARGRIEKILGTWKRCSGLRRMRWRGLAKAAVQVHLTAIAYSYDRLHHFIGAGVWDSAPLEATLWQQADDLVGGEKAWLIIDDTALPKKGNASVGVAPQYASALGKNANCQTLVSVTLASGEVPLMLSLRLFLPESWMPA